MERFRGNWVQEPDRISENEIADGEAYHRALYINGDIGSPARQREDLRKGWSN